MRPLEQRSFLGQLLALPRDGPRPLRESVGAASGETRVTEDIKNQI
jgi:hypothetical protein